MIFQGNKIGILVLDFVLRNKQDFDFFKRSYGTFHLLVISSHKR